MKKKFQQEVLTDHINKLCEFKKTSWVKRLIYAYMGGVLIGLTCVGYFLVNMNVADKGIAIFLGALVFPVGIIMCFFLGGYLFSSNVLLILGVLKQRIKWYDFLFNMFIIFIMNGLGCLTIAGLVYAVGTLNSLTNKIVEWAIHHKIEPEWWKTFLSGILCNMIVCGAAFVYYGSKNKALATFVVYAMIFLFAISGYNHIVANFFYLSQAGLLSIGTSNQFTGEQVGMIFYNNFIPSALGNMVGGSIIGVTYFICEIEWKKKKQETVDSIDVSKENN